MSQHSADGNEPAEDRLVRGMRVERVTRPDGRYLLYYAWPPGTDRAGSDQATPDPAAGGDDV